MKFFVDTADTADIADLAATGLLDGVTTNPSLIAKAGRNFLEVVAEICTLTSGPVSAEVVALDHATMMKEAEILRKIADNVCVKVPLTIDRPENVQGADFGWDDGQCHAVFRRDTSFARRKSRRDVHFAVRRPVGRQWL